jgi:hypothetical protein
MIGRSGTEVPARPNDVWEFFFCAPPLKVTTAAGSPINPLAIK